MIKVKKRKILLLPGDGIGPEVIAEVKKIDRLELSWNFNFSTSNFSKEHSKFIVEKGSISINGVSLTIARLKNKSSDKSFDIYYLIFLSLFFF